ncbi:MAG: DUF1513 domain-containing protein, partial [Pseudomonadota bacterium]
GLETHPDYGRTPLNLDGFRSELIGLDAQSGAIDTMGVWHGAENVSLRHLSEDERGHLYVGGQVQGAPSKESSRVVWRVRNGIAEPIDLGDRLGGYVSSIASHGRTTVVASKRSGHAFTLVDGDVTEIKRVDGASAVAVGDHIRATSGYTSLHLEDQQVAALAGHEFDNHGAML